MMRLSWLPWFAMQDSHKSSLHPYGTSVVCRSQNLAPSVWIVSKIMPLINDLSQCWNATLL